MHGTFPTSEFRDNLRGLDQSSSHPLVSGHYDARITYEAAHHAKTKSKKQEIN